MNMPATATLVLPGLTGLSRDKVERHRLGAQNYEDPKPELNSDNLAMVNEWRSA